MIKKIMSFMILSLTVFLSGCAYLDFDFNFTTLSTTLPQTYPTLVDGTMTIDNDDYIAYSSYHSPTYELTDMDAYNDVLLATKDAIRRSNVQVTTTIYRTNPYFPYTTIVESTMNGSGVIYQEDDTHYYVVTNEHVTNNKGKSASYEVVVFDSSTPVSAELIAYDEDLDIAVLKFLKPSDGDVAIMDITSRIFYQFNPGELVLAVGNPLSVVNNVTFGEFLSMQTISNVSFDVIYHNAMIHEGSSGGALTDVDGHFLGLNTWGSSDTDEQSFAIPNYIVYMFLTNHGLLT